MKANGGIAVFGRTVKGRLRFKSHSATRSLVATASRLPSGESARASMAARVAVEREQLVTLAKLPEVTPFPTAQIQFGFPRPGGACRANGPRTHGYSPPALF